MTTKLDPNLYAAAMQKVYADYLKYGIDDSGGTIDAVEMKAVMYDLLADGRVDAYESAALSYYFRDHMDAGAQEVYDAACKRFKDSHGAGAR